MTANKILYTDGRDVTVTDSALQVKKSTYNLDGITRYGLSILTPDRLPTVMLLGLGILLAVAGWLQLISPDTIPDFRFANDVVSANTAALWLGGAFLIIGLITLAFMRKRYAVRITTAEGDKDAVVSHKREYISQIVNALNEAFSFLRTTKRVTYIPVKK